MGILLPIQAWAKRLLRDFLGLDHREWPPECRERIAILDPLFLTSPRALCIHISSPFPPYF